MCSPKTPCGGASRSGGLLARALGAALAFASLHRLIAGFELLHLREGFLALFIAAPLAHERHKELQQLWDARHQVLRPAAAVLQTPFEILRTATRPVRTSGTYLLVSDAI